MSPRSAAKPVGGQLPNAVSCPVPHSSGALPVVSVVDPLSCCTMARAAASHLA